MIGLIQRLREYKRRLDVLWTHYVHQVHQSLPKHYPNTDSQDWGACSCPGCLQWAHRDKGGICEWCAEYCGKKED